MTIKVTCESTNRQEMRDSLPKVFVSFGSAGSGTGKLVSGTELGLQLTSTDLDKIGWARIGREYEVEIREITE